MSATHFKTLSPQPANAAVGKGANVLVSVATGELAVNAILDNRLNCTSHLLLD